MKKLISVTALCLLTLAVSAQNKMNVELPDIRTVEVSGDIVLRMSRGAENAMNCEVGFDMNNNLKWSMKDEETLSIKHSRPLMKKDREAVVVYLTASDLKAVRAMSGATVLGESPIEFSAFSITADAESTVSLEVDAKVILATATNKSNIVLKGDCDYLTVRARYNSTVHAEGMKTGIAVVDTFVSSECRIDADELLVLPSNIEGTVYYREGTEVVSSSSSNKNKIRAYSGQE